MAVKFWIENGCTYSDSEDSPAYKDFKKRQKERRDKLYALMLDTVAQVQPFAVLWSEANGDEPDAEMVVDCWHGYKHKIRTRFYLDGDLVEMFIVEFDFENHLGINEVRVQDYLFTIREFIRDYRREHEEVMEILNDILFDREMSKYKEDLENKIIERALKNGN